MTKLLVEQPQLAKDPNFIKTEKEFSETSNVPLSNNKILAASIVVIKPNRFSPGPIVRHYQSLVLKVIR